MIYWVRAHRSGCAVEVFTIENEVENIVGVCRTPREQVDDVVKYWGWMRRDIRRFLIEEYGAELTDMRYTCNRVSDGCKRHQVELIAENVFDEYSTLKIVFDYPEWDLDMGDHEGSFEINYERTIHHETKPCSRGIRYSTNFDRQTCNITEQWKTNIDLDDLAKTGDDWVDRKFKELFRHAVRNLINAGNYEE